MSDGMPVPKKVSQLNDGLLVRDVNRVLRVKFDENAWFILATTKHHGAGDHGMRANRALLRKRDELFAGTEN